MGETGRRGAGSPPRAYHRRVLPRLDAAALRLLAGRGAAGVLFILLFPLAHPELRRAFRGRWRDPGAPDTARCLPAGVSSAAPPRPEPRSAPPLEGQAGRSWWRRLWG